MEPFAKSCHICIRRDREEGGNGSCPQVAVMRAHKQAITGDNGCASFKLGDLRSTRAPEPPSSESLF